MYALFLAFGRFAVIVRSQQLTVGDGKHGLSRNGGSIHIVRQELEFTIKPLLLLYAVEVVNGKGHLLITIPLPEVQLFGRIVIPMFYHLSHKFHGGIIFFLISLPFGLYHHFIQGIRYRRKGDGKTDTLCRMNKTGVFIISNGRNNQHGLGAVGLERKLSFVIGHTSFGSTFQIHRCIWERLTG